jgi:methyl-accepting chemotaxis protein
MTLKAKMLYSQVALVVFSALLITGVAVWQANRGFNRVGDENRQGLQEASAAAREGLIDAGKAALTQIATDVYATCRAQQDLLEQKVRADLNVAADVLAQAGALTLADETVAWTAVNQVSEQAQQVTLPRMLVSGQWLGQVDDPQTPALIVDHVKNLVGGTCTIFQRMNDAGDMLRVCTNVEGTDGRRAIGTFIPAIGADGQPNAVVSAVLKGQTFAGRAFVVREWYVTAYQPLRDADGKIVGMLYVGVPEQSVTSLKEAVQSVKIGDTGYVFVLNATGRTRGHYVISPGGQRDGDSIWEAKDNTGRPVIQEMCALAAKLKPGEAVEYSYDWLDPGAAQPRKKLATLTYFAPWDWVIGASAYEDEFYTAANEMDARAAEIIATVEAAGDDAVRGTVIGSVAVGLGVAVLAVGVALLVTRAVTRPIIHSVGELTDGAARVSEAAGQVSSTSTSLADGANQQASSLEETSAAIQQLSAMTQRNASSAAEADELARATRSAAETGDQTVGQLNDAMERINTASAQIQKVIKVIEEIAFQTNLLALNAAVEAARAGDHGKGFAVVAGEVRALALRAAEAARETTTLIDAAVASARDGSGVAGNVAELLSTVAKDVARVTDLIGSIAQASAEQARGVEQIESAVGQMDRVTQGNAAAAEESAAAAEELSAQSISVTEIAQRLGRIVGVRSAT